MTQGKFIFILNSNGDSLVTPSFNGDMYMDGRRGSEAIELLKRCKNIKDFEATALRFVKLYKLDANYSDEQLEECDTDRNGRHEIREEGHAVDVACEL